MTSERFPGKVLADLGGVPMIVFMAARVRRAQRVDRLLVATSMDPSDDPVALAVACHGIECFRGELADVLDRYYQAARSVAATHVVRLTGDCPLIDADLIDAALAELEQGEADYVGTVNPPTFPDGLDVEAFTFGALERAWQQARAPAEREHVTTWLRAPGNARLKNIAGERDMSKLRWTVDHPADLEHVRALVAAANRADFDRFDLYRALEAKVL